MANEATKGGKPARPATIVHVAEAAGVAVGTVSRYINGQPIRTGNREQIERAIADLGYRRNAVAVSMKTNLTNTVGVMVPTIGEFHASLLEHLTRRLRQAGRAVICYCHDIEALSFMEGLEFFANHRVDAVVMDGHEELDDRLRPYIDRGLIAVLYDKDQPGLLADRVFVENQRMSRRLVDHLLDLGHRRIGIIHGRLSGSVGKERLAGYREALAARGIAEDPSLMVDGRWSEAGGVAATRELMTLAEPPTAIFGANYNMTIGALRWLRENGHRIPDDISIVSFDDVPGFTLHEPGITAIAQPTDKIAETIAAVIDERLNDPGAVGRRTYRIDNDISLRGSTKPPRTKPRRR